MRQFNVNAPVQRGFSLIELMVSLLIGLIVLAGILQVVINSKRSYVDNQEMSQIQENIRFAMDIVGRDVRMAGYFGCANLGEGAVNSKEVDGVNGFLVAADQNIEAISGYSDKATFPVQFRDDAADNTNAIIIRYSEPLSEKVVTQPVVAADGEVVLSDTADLDQGDPVVIVSPDCVDALVFNVDAVEANSISGVPAQGLNDIALGGFAVGSRVSRVVTHAYYIGDSKVLPGTPALMREVIVDGNKTRSEEIALGIENLQIEYGLAEGALPTAGAPGSTPPNYSVSYKSAEDTTAADMLNVTAVRISMTLRSQAQVHLIDQTTNFLGIEKTDRFLRQEASTTILIRNREV